MNWNKNTKSVCLIICFLIFSPSLFSQNTSAVLGKWKTIDHETGQTQSIVELLEESGKVYGKILEVLDPDAKGTTCEHCSGERKGQPFVGMRILWDMEKEGDSNTWSAGHVFSPERDKTFTCKMWLEKSDSETVLKVRGYYYAFFATQTWYRVK